MSTTFTTCPCGSGHSYDNCCEPIIKGLRPAETAEQLMRARYSAYVAGEIDFLIESTIPEERQNCSRDEMIAWSQQSTWKGFSIIATDKGGADDEEGTVEFIARYANRNADMEHHELSIFKKINGKWYFYDGKIIGPQPYVRSTPKVGPNDPCPCGSGKKFKKCCGK